MLKKSSLFIVAIVIIFGLVGCSTEDSTIPSELPIETNDQNEQNDEYKKFYAESLTEIEELKMF